MLGSLKEGIVNIFVYDYIVVHISSCSAISCLKDSVSLFKLYLKDKSGEISGKLGLFPMQQARGILNSLLSSSN